MKDIQIIDTAYEETVKQLFSILFSVYATTEEKIEHRQAEQRFQSSVQLARETRDRAKQLL